jgi:hypothetical protein
VSELSIRPGETVSGVSRRIASVSVLVFDPSQQWGEAYATALGSFGYRSISSARSKDALERFVTDTAVEALVCDVADGWSETVEPLVRRVRSVRPTALAMRAKRWDITAIERAAEYDCTGWIPADADTSLVPLIVSMSIRLHIPTGL